ncbi:hypothetical protein ACIO7M_04005 [Streptomyces toxytricini]|uniref:Integral membrane protein n=1 Tax=Streptomyces toxytricini TaxID=67369 RepID=A0ABW8EAL9_STRT5
MTQHGHPSPAPARGPHGAADLQESPYRAVGPGRLLMLWGAAAAGLVGWSLIGLAVASVEDRDPYVVLFAPVYTLLGLGVLLPAGIGWARTTRRDREAAGAAAADPAGAAALRAPRLVLAWRLSSGVLLATGAALALAAAAAAASRAGGGPYAELVHGIGSGAVLAAAGLAGLARVRAHRRRVRTLTGRRRAPRSASTGRPRRG